MSRIANKMHYALTADSKALHWHDNKYIFSYNCRLRIISVQPLCWTRPKHRNLKHSVKHTWSSTWMSLIVYLKRVSQIARWYFLFDIILSYHLVDCVTVIKLHVTVNIMKEKKKNYSNVMVRNVTKFIWAMSSKKLLERRWWRIILFNFHMNTIWKKWESFIFSLSWQLDYVDTNINLTISNDFTTQNYG